MRGKPFSSLFSSQIFIDKWRGTILSAMGLAIIVASIFFALPRPYSAHAASGDWSTYMNGNDRSGYNSSETIINQTTAPNLKLHWTYKGGGAITSQPVTFNGLIYWGSFDGYEHATDLNGKLIWQQFLGTQTTCTNFTSLGIVGTAAVTSVVINGVSTSVVYVAGGDTHLYALDAMTGAIIWSTPLGGTSTNAFIWDSPLFYNNNVYIGIATTGEPTCTVVPGQFFELNAVTGQVEYNFSTVPAGCTGAGIWGSPTLDTTDNSIYFATGNRGNCSEPYALGLIKLRTTDLSYESSWSIPFSKKKDSDFGSTPTLFTATIGGTLRQLVGLVNKNGIYYTFDRSAISNGPIWTASIAIAGACPECGQGSISSSEWDGSRLYVAGGNTTINGLTCKGSLQALNPADGTVIWQSCLSGTVMGAVSGVPGVVAVVAGRRLTLVNADTGAILFNYTGVHFYSSPSISNGILYVGTFGGRLYAFGT